MKKTALMAVMVCAVLAVASLVGCGGSSSSSAASSASGSSSASASASASASSAAASSAAASSSASAASGVMEIDGVVVKELGFDMVGDTPNFMVIFSNPTDKDIEVDLSKFQIKLDDKDEVSFHLTSKTIPANTSYAQNAFTASPGSMKAGDSVTVYYDGNLVGTFEVQEF